MNNRSKMPFVSIIVPVFNTEKYLEQCVESLLKQTYENIEIILIDDGSTDSSYKICDFYSQKYDIVKTIHKENGGLTSARKIGLESFTGDFVMFVDSDDWLDEDAVEKCVYKAIEDHADCVLFSYVREYWNSSIKNEIFANDFCYRGAQAKDKVHRRLIGPLEEELSMPHKLDSASTVCMKLYKKEVAGKGLLISERVVGTSEDTIFNIFALEGCETISYINFPLYHYRKTNEQSLTSRHIKDLAEKWDVLYDLILSYIERNKFEASYMEAFYNRVACGMIGLGLNEINAPYSFFEKKRIIAAILNKPRYKKAFQLLNIKYCPLKWKFFFFLCKMCCSLGVVILLYVMNYLRSRLSN